MRKEEGEGWGLVICEWVSHDGCCDYLPMGVGCDVVLSMRVWMK